MATCVRVPVEPTPPAEPYTYRLDLSRTEARFVRALCSAVEGDGEAAEAANDILNSMFGQVGIRNVVDGRIWTNNNSLVNKS